MKNGTAKMFNSLRINRRFSSCSFLRDSLFKSYVDRIAADVSQVSPAHVDSKLTSFVKGNVQGRPTNFRLLDVRYIRI